MQGLRLRHLAAAAVAFSIALAPMAAADDTLFQGRVTDDAGEGRAGVVLALVTPDGETAYRSEPSSGSGDFRIESAPAGEYRLIAETDAVAFATPGAVSVGAGTNAPVTLQLADYQSGAGVSNSGWNRWGRWLVGGAIVIAAYVVIDELSDDIDEDAATPF